MSIAIIMGSDSDWKTMKAAKEICLQFEVECSTQVLSAHRTPHETIQFAQEAKKNGIKIIIAGAGGAAHLPGIVAACTTLPVIGVPIKSKLDGMDSLLSIVQMPKGIPVATVAIDNAANAALLALRILGIADHKLDRKMELYQEQIAQESKDKNKNLI